MKGCIFVIGFLCTSLLWAGCMQKDDVTVKTENRAVHISNTSIETVYYLLYPARVMQYITLSPTCTEQNAIKPGETKSISYETILQTGETDEAVIYWWRCEEGKMEASKGDAQAIRVSL